MANKKISALSALGTTPAGGDVLPITDVSGTPTTKKVTVTNLMGAAPVQSVAGRTGAVTIANTDVSGLGTAATLNVGTADTNVVQLADVSGTVKLPAVDGSQLTNVSGTDSTKLAIASNLSDLNNAGTARTNLGLGTAATSASTDFSPAVLSVLTTKTSNYTVQASDLGKVIKMSSSSAVLDVTIPSSLGAGFRCTIVQEGSVKCRVVAGSGVTLNNWNSQLHTAGQYGAINVFAYASDTFLATGDVGDAPAALLGYTGNALGNTSTLYTISTQPQYHFDASEASTITESGGAVSAWNDISGNSRNAAQGTGTNQPTYTTSGGQNSKSFINFDGSNDFMTISSSLSFTGASTYILVSDSSGVVNGLSEDPNSGASEFYTMTNSTSGRWGSGGSYVGFTASASTNGFAILTYQNDGSSNAVLDLNGSTTELATASNAAISSSFPVVANAIGHGGSYQNYHNGKIYEIIAFNTNLETTSLTDLNVIVSYLAAKYNVSLGSF